MKIEFEKQFGKGTDPWYAKAERWVKKKFKNPYLQHLALGFVAWLKKIWIEGKIQMEMASVCLLYTSPSPRDVSRSRMPSSA